MTNVPAPTFNSSTGFVPPSTAAVLAGVQENINEAFGGNLNPALDTPQGQIATSETAIIQQVNTEFIYLANMFDPAFSQGRYQDALAGIYFLERNPSQPTVVQASCSGLTGVVIPVGATAVDSAGNRYMCTEQGTIPISGTIQLPFANIVPGPIPCPAGALDQIYQSIPGWDSVNNASDGVIGNDVESRSAFEARRAATVAANSVGSLPSIQGAVLKVTNVIDAYVTENDQNTSAVIGGVTLAAHSLYVAVVGGEATDIARAIWSRKAPGCAYNGNTTVVVEDTDGYSPPYPQYPVQFEIPDELPIFFSVVLANGPDVPANAAQLVQAAVVSAFAGGDGGARARIGSTVYASRFYAPVAAIGSWVRIVSITLGSPNAPAATFTGAISGTALTVSGVSGTILAGQALSDATGNVAAGTTIVSGAGASWVVSISQTVSSEAMQTINPNLFDVPVDIDQVPTIAANDVLVSLT